MTPNNFREKANLRLAGSGRYASRARCVQGARVRGCDSDLGLTHGPACSYYLIFITNQQVNSIELTTRLVLGQRISLVTMYFKPADLEGLSC